MVAALQRVEKMQVQAGTAILHVPVWDLEMGKEAGWFLALLCDTGTLPEQRHSIRLCWRGCIGLWGLGTGMEFKLRMV